MTTNPSLSPAPLYSVASPVPLSDTQNGEMGLNDTPQGLAKSGSVVFAIPGISDTKFVCVKLFAPSATTRCALAHNKSIAATTRLMQCITFMLVLIGFSSTEVFRAAASLPACKSLLQHLSCKLLVTRLDTGIPLVRPLRRAIPWKLPHSGDVRSYQLSMLSGSAGLDLRRVIRQEVARLHEVGRKNLAIRPR